jgi:hypothetical protein
MVSSSRGGRGKKLLDPWRLLSNILSGIFMTLGVFLILMAIAEIIVYLIDSVINGNESYLGWWSTPFLMILVSLPFFLGYLVVNLNRFRFYHRIREKLAFRMPDRERKDPRRMDKIELD